MAARPTSCDTATATIIPSTGLLPAGTVYKLGSKTRTITADIGANSNTIINVCKGQTLTLSNGVNGGGLMINVDSGATLVFNSLEGEGIASTTINVYGSMVSNNPGLTLNSNADLLVASSGVLTANSLTQNSRSAFLLEGTATVQTFIGTNNSIPTCINKGGCLKTGSISLNNAIVSNDVGLLYINSTTCPTSTLISNSPTKVCFPGPGPCNNSGGTSVFGTSVVRFNCPAGNTCSAALALPVQLVYFKAFKRHQGAICKWEISSYYKTKYFVVEKSLDGIYWEDVGKIPLENKESSSNTYSISDDSPFSGISYYKLSEVDINDNITPYSISMLEMESSNNLKIYPNPSHGELNIEVTAESEASTFELSDVHGKLRYKIQLSSGVHTLEKIVIESGIYIARLKTNRTFTTQKIVVTTE